MKNKHISPRPSFVMECCAYSVLTRWFKSVFSGAGSEPSPDQMAKQPLHYGGLHLAAGSSRLLDSGNGAQEAGYRAAASTVSSTLQPAARVWQVGYSLARSQLVSLRCVGCHTQPPAPSGCRRVECGRLLGSGVWEARWCIRPLSGSESESLIATPQ